MSTGSPNTPVTHVAREDCPHLADPEWEALQRLSTVIGEAAVATMFRTLSPTEQHGVALGFIMKEQREVAARATVSTPSTPRVESLKLHVNSYVGREGEPLLRWLVEVDTAITARRIVDPLSKVAFAMSRLGRRARSWASRAEFLDLQQGKHDVHANAQRARYLVSNIVTNPIDEATKVVTFMKGLSDGPVPNRWTSRVRRLLDPSSVVDQRMCVVSDAETTVTMPVSAQRLCTQPRADVTIPGIATGSKQTKATSRRGDPAGDAVERVDIGHAVSKTAAPNESHSHCKKKDDKPNLVILKVNSKRESSLRALVDFGASNNFVRLQGLARLDFEEVEVPRSILEVGLATGVVVRTEKRVVRAHFSYEEKKFVDVLIVPDLDDKFDMVLGMPWLARHDPVIDWAKRTIMCFRSSGAAESDGPVGTAHAPRGACDPPAEAARGATASDHSARKV
ncbi:unnamed protein product [Phytophthora fragariaefolia]|uniref:Unnamed protein product n=1 Tax=Phytophthora fragariaefolia TaxID=1490495 RepID=A0A9W6XW75_9STRA|nr:unnamed protein product [Phytophthora fragariaefolia]